jgi:hypothetical protein
VKKRHLEAVDQILAALIRRILHGGWGDEGPDHADSMHESAAPLGAPAHGEGPDPLNRFDAFARTLLL